MAVIHGRFTWRIGLPLVLFTLAALACNMPRAVPTPTPELAAPPTLSASHAHTVAAGETLGSIARHYGVGVNVLASSNGIANPDLLYAGQTLSIPEASTASGADSQVYLNVPVVKQSRSLSCESASACSLMRYMGYGCSDDMLVFNALPKSPDNPHRGFVGSVDMPAGSLPPGAALAQVGGYGIYVEALAAGLQTLGVPAEAAYHVTFDSLRALLNHDMPVLIIATHGMGTYGHEPVSFIPADGIGAPVTVVRYQHSYLLIGYDAEGFWAIDPWSASIEYFTNDWLKTDWNRLGRQALWITR